MMLFALFLVPFFGYKPSFCISCEKKSQNSNVSSENSACGLGSIKLECYFSAISCSQIQLAKKLMFGLTGLKIS